MRWWKHLYMGENAARNRVRILEGIENGKHLVDTYVITLPENGNHIFDILPVALLEKQEREKKELYILGIARGYQEAAKVVRSMIDDMYQKTGKIDWPAYMDSFPEQTGAVYEAEKKQ